MKYQFQLDNRAAGSVRLTWAAAAQDAVNGGYATWGIPNESVHLDDTQGAAIAEIEVDLTEPFYANLVGGPLDGQRWAIDDNQTKIEFWQPAPVSVIPTDQPPKPERTTVLYVRSERSRHLYVHQP